MGIEFCQVPGTPVHGSNTCCCTAGKQYSAGHPLVSNKHVGVPVCWSYRRRTSIVVYLPPVIVPLFYPGCVRNMATFGPIPPLKNHSLVTLDATARQNIDRLFRRPGEPSRPGETGRTQARALWDTTATKTDSDRVFLYTSNS